MNKNNGNSKGILIKDFYGRVKLLTSGKSYQFDTVSIAKIYAYENHIKIVDCFYFGKDDVDKRIKTKLNPLFSL